MAGLLFMAAVSILGSTPVAVCHDDRNANFLPAAAVKMAGHTYKHAINIGQGVKNAAGAMSSASLPGVVPRALQQTANNCPSVPNHEFVYHHGWPGIDAIECYAVLNATLNATSIMEIQQNCTQMAGCIAFTIFTYPASEFNPPQPDEVPGYCLLRGPTLISPTPTMLLSSKTGLSYCEGTYIRLAYAALPNLDYTADLPGWGGAALNAPGPNKCNNQTCCRALCDSNPNCGVYMFGSLSWCPNCCWLKQAPTPARVPSALSGVTSYVKLTLQQRRSGYASGILNLDYTADLPGLGGAALNGKCNTEGCCKAMCDGNPDCGVYMFGSLSWCPNCCWLKRFPTSASTLSALSGIKTYVKLTDEDKGCPEQLPLPGYDFQRQMGVVGRPDIACLSALINSTHQQTVQFLLDSARTACTARSDCHAFVVQQRTSEAAPGYCLKGAASPTVDLSLTSTPKRCHGIHIKRASGCVPTPANYIFQRQLDSPGSDITCEPLNGRTLDQIAQACNAQTRCVAFNRFKDGFGERFCLKTVGGPLSSSGVMANACHGMYQKDFPPRAAFSMPNGLIIQTLGDTGCIEPTLSHFGQLGVIAMMLTKTCSKTNVNQHFMLENAGGNWYMIILRGGTRKGQCLAMQLDEYGGGEKLYVTPCTGGDNGLFSFTPHRDGYHMRPKHTRMCVDVDFSNPLENLKQRECNETARTQLFKLEPLLL